ncbi:MAG: dihydrolipoyllysine-residue succinyltransferase component of 2-oxoglutarate dehydrogenase complex [Candidatus Hydrogenedentota bacterium]
MAVELKVPTVGESITEVQIGAWRKSSGDWVEQDEAVVELESDKATVELPAPVAGTITEILKKEGDTAEVGEVIGYVDDSGKKGDGKRTSDEKVAKKEDGEPKSRVEDKKKATVEVPKADAAQEKEPAESKAKSEESDVSEEEAIESAPSKAKARVMPAARRAMAEHGLDVDDVEGTGAGGRILKEDVLRMVSEDRLRKEEAKPKPESRPEEPAKVRGSRDEESVPMTPMRRRIAERLVEAQHTGALLTTFNEIDMSGVVALREEHKAEFQEKHGVKLGFMSFFVKASVEALKEYPKVNAEIRQDDIVYHHYYDVGIAVGGGKGLVVPVLRNAEAMSFAGIEKQIADFGARAQENKIKLEELEGGTFTISNGGVYGSLLSTPIVNPPQSGILGLHAIQDRPVAIDGQVVIRPMMYVALTYDHRIVDGREAVTFLRHIKNSIEKPARLLLEL